MIRERERERDLFNDKIMEQRSKQVRKEIKNSLCYLFSSNDIN